VAHGVTAIDDPAVVDLVRRGDITLDMCPTSTVQAGLVADVGAHPLAALHRAGVSVTISTDDRTVSDVTLTDEMVSAAALMGLSPAELSAIARNAFERAFSPRGITQALATAADREWEAWAATAGAAIS
jgi:adenosine deaminase